MIFLKQASQTLRMLEVVEERADASEWVRWLIACACVLTSCAAIITFLENME